MTTANSLATGNFNSDMNTNASWDASVPNVPFPAPIAIPESENIIAELSLYTSAINTPVPMPDNAASPVSEDEKSLFRNGPSKKRQLTPLPLRNNKKAKFELATEPVTPGTNARFTPLPAPKVVVPPPMSPTADSVCTEEGEERSSSPASVLCTDSLSMPPTPMPASVCLPKYSKDETAKRRALRKAALKRNRSRKEEGRPIKSEPTKSEVEGASAGEPLDKKAARAIRNREAAMKSRVEAKQRMRNLQLENDSLAVKVKSLSEENKALTQQLKTLLQHAMGVSVPEGEDVRDAFNMFAPVAARSS